eukprot:1173925-Prymnesium_polylepis.1
MTAPFAAAAARVALITGFNRSSTSLELIRQMSLSAPGRPADSMGPWKSFPPRLNHTWVTPGPAFLNSASTEYLSSMVGRAGSQFQALVPPTPLFWTVAAALLGLGVADDQDPAGCSSVRDQAQRQQARVLHCCVRVCIQ